MSKKAMRRRMPVTRARIARQIVHLRVFAGTTRLWWWATISGVLSAVCVVGFRHAVAFVEWVGTGHSGGLVEAARSIAPWRRVAVCLLGGILAGAVLEIGNRWAARAARGAVNLDYIDAAREGRVDLNDRTTISRTLSALLSVGTGASIGREGPMVQLSAWVSAWLARLSTVPAEQRSVLMVCGIASGIGAAYHAPIAGVVFVLELALGFFGRHTVAPVLIASSVSGALIYWWVEPLPVYTMDLVTMAPTSLGLALGVGLLFGLLGWAVLGMLNISRRVFARVRWFPLRLGIGGLAVGLLSIAAPEVWGNGYSIVSSVLRDAPGWQWLSWLLLAKIIATVISSGSGSIGGVFTPSIFVGAVSGSVIAQLASTWLPVSIVGDPRLLSVVGMAAVLAAVTHAPLMAIVMVLEMTHQFQLTIPVMLASGVAYAVSTHFGAKPLYGNPIEAHA
jgi:CIC family chloride channel protein